MIRSLQATLLGLSFAVGASAHAQSPLTTTFGGGAGLGPESAVWFDLQLAIPLLITQVDVNLLGGLNQSGSIEFWTTPNTWVGNDANPGAWTLLQTAPLVGAAQSTPTTVPMPLPFLLPAGSHGVAIVYHGVGPVFANGNGFNQVWSRTELVMTCGAAGGVFTGATQNPRVWNGAIHYVDGRSAATFARYGTGCYDQRASFYESYPAGSFDLASVTAQPNSILLQDVGTGGWFVQPGSGTWYTPTAAAIALLDDQVTGVLALPFPLVTPAGTTNGIVVSSNGFVWTAPNGNAGPGAPNGGDFFGQPERFAPLWLDLDPTLGGSVHFDVAPGNTAAYVTFVNVPERGRPGTANTFQIAFFPNGAVEYRWLQCANTGGAALVGWTPGNGAGDPGSVDLSTALPFLTLRESSPLGLTATARPVLGTGLSLRVDAIPAGTPFGLVVFSFTQHAAGLPLSVLGAPGCFQYVDADATLGFLPAGNPSRALPIAIPNQASLAGTSAFVQSAALAGGFNALGIVFSNGLELRVDRN